MKRMLRLCAVSTLALGLGAVAGAQVNPDVRRAEEKEKEKASSAAPRRRSISPDVAAQLSAATPKFTPAPPVAPRPQEEAPDLREIDKPRNGIIRLDPVIVQERRNPVLNERAITTDKGLADIAVRRYISETDRALNRFTLPLFGTSMEKRALAMYEEDERLKNMSDLRANAVDAAKSDPEAGEAIRRESQQTFMRTPDFGYQRNK